MGFTTEEKHFTEWSVNGQKHVSKTTVRSCNFLNICSCVVNVQLTTTQTCGNTAIAVTFFNQCFNSNKITSYVKHFASQFSLTYNHLTTC